LNVDYLIAPKKSPLIIGHRGASAVAPENTIVAFAQAFADGAHGIEFDVRLASDGVPVVIHNPSLRHTGQRSGRVARMNSGELAQTDVGSWFNASHPPFALPAYAKQRIPTLEQVLTLLEKQTGNELIAYVELKTVRRQAANAQLAETVVELVERRNIQDRVIIISFNLRVIELVKQLAPAFRTGALFGPRQRATHSARGMVSAALACGADEILLHHLVAKRGILNLARAAKLNPVVWTVDDPKWLSRARILGVHALMTNNPARMLKSLQLSS